MLPSERRDWMENLGAPELSGSTETLLYIGCTAPHDPRVGKMARAIVALLTKAAVSFGVLTEEVCCGSPSLRMGEELLFDDLVQKNI
jgi:Fe-S oxidoreductase